MAWKSNRKIGIKVNCSTATSTLASTVLLRTDVRAQVVDEQIRQAGQIGHFMCCLLTRAPHYKLAIQLRDVKTAMVLRHFVYFGLFDNCTD